MLAVMGRLACCLCEDEVHEGRLGRGAALEAHCDEVLQAERLRGCSDEHAACEDVSLCCGVVPLVCKHRRLVGEETHELV